MSCLRGSCCQRHRSVERGVCPEFSFGVVRPECQRLARADVWVLSAQRLFIAPASGLATVRPACRRLFPRLVVGFLRAPSGPLEHPIRHPCTRPSKLPKRTRPSLLCPPAGRLFGFALRLNLGPSCSHRPWLALPNCRCSRATGWRRRAGPGRLTARGLGV